MITFEAGVLITLLSEKPGYYWVSLSCYTGWTHIHFCTFPNLDQCWDAASRATYDRKKWTKCVNKLILLSKSYWVAVQFHEVFNLSLKVVTEVCICKFDIHNFFMTAAIKASVPLASGKTVKYSTFFNSKAQNL